MRSSLPRRNQRIKRKIYSGFNFRIFLRRYTKIALVILKTILLAGLFGLAAYFIFFSTFFQIKEIEVTGTKRFVNEADLREIAGTLILGRNIFREDMDKVEETLENNFMGADEIAVSKALPAKIKLLVIERVPIAIFYKEDKETFFLVDREGYVLGYADPSSTDLPRIRYQGDLEVGLFVDKGLVPLYMELTSLLEQEQVPVSSMSFNPGYVSFYVQNGPEVLIGNEKDKPENIKAVSALIKQTQLEDKDLQRIDLRYDKVIVLFE